MLRENAENRYTDFQITDYYKTNLKIYNREERPDSFILCLYAIPLTSRNEGMNTWGRVWPRMWKLIDRKC